MQVILPHYPNMFSEGKNFPAKSVLVRTQTLANDQPLPGTTMISKTNVGGPDRFRYFGQPLVPYVPTFALGYNSGADASTSNRKPLLNNNNATKANPPTTAASQHSSNSKGQQTNDHKSQPAADDWYTKYSQMDAMIEFVVGDQFRTVGVQTVYRESDAQTMPYSPAYVISKLQPQGTIPELVRLGHLTWGNGLPITKDELDLIEREQQKRKWFETLPPATTDSQREIVIEQRSKREAEDWEFRESQIKRYSLCNIIFILHTLTDSKMNDWNW